MYYIILLKHPFVKRNSRLLICLEVPFQNVQTLCRLEKVKYESVSRSGFLFLFFSALSLFWPMWEIGLAAPLTIVNKHIYRMERRARRRPREERNRKRNDITDERRLSNYSGVKRWSPNLF